MSLWVQVHDIPISYLNREVAEELCEAIGVVDRNSKDEEVDGGSFIRVRVRVDISVPLCRGRLLSIEDEEELWVSFKYERLPNICYWCGCLDHSDRDCGKWIDSDGTLDSSNKKYGPWIQAPTPQIRRKPVVVVPGFYETRKHGGARGSRPVEKKAAPLSREARVQDSHANLSVGKETDGAEAQFVEAVNAVDDKSVKPSELKEDNDGNKGDFMENQIREIDRELNEFDLSGSKVMGVTTNHNEGHVVNRLHETKSNLLGEVESGHEAGAGHVEHLKLPNTGTNGTLQPDTQVAASSRTSKEGSKTRTWTRVARVTQSVDECSIGEVILSSKRTMMEVDNNEVPKKRKMVGENNQKFSSMVEAAGQPHQGQ